MTEEQREKNRERFKKYYCNHKDVHRERCKKWAEDNKEKLREIHKEYNKKYYASHKEEIARKRREKNPPSRIIVVRCKDCKKRKTDKCLMYWNEIKDDETWDDNWFCADAERQEGR